MSDEPRYHLAHVPQDPVVRTPAFGLGEVLLILRGQHALGCRLAPFFVFQADEATARAIWCPQCGRVSWNAQDALHWYCGFCHTCYRA